MDSASGQTFFHLHLQQITLPALPSEHLVVFVVDDESVFFYISFYLILYTYCRDFFCFGIYVVISIADSHSKLDYLKIYQLSLWLQTVWLLKLKIFVFLQPSSCVDVTQPPGCWCVCPPMSALLGPHQFSAARPYFSPNCAKAATVQLRVTRL